MDVKLDLEIITGGPGGAGGPGGPGGSSGPVAVPAIVFVHGLGMDKHIWTDPPKARMLGGLFPLGAVIRGKSSLRTLYQDMREAGYTVAAWSQRRPVYKLSHAVNELSHVLGLLRAAGHGRIILVCHSRGGLIARLYLKQKGDSAGVAGLITICTPHQGTNMARWAVYLSPMASSLSGLLPENSKGIAAKALGRSLDMLNSPGIKELLPESGLFKELGESVGVECFSAGGTDPGLFGVMGLSFPEILLKFLPEKAIYEEIRKGSGDGLVSALSARAPSCLEHRDFPVNHLTAVFDGDIRDTVSGWIGRFSAGG